MWESSHFFCFTPHLQNIQKWLCRHFGHFETLGQEKRDSLCLRHSQRLSRANVVRCQLCKNNWCRNGYDWLTMVIKKDTVFCFSLQSGPLCSLQPFEDVALALVFVKESAICRINTPNVAKHHVCDCVAQGRCGGVINTYRSGM